MPNQGKEFVWLFESQRNLSTRITLFRSPVHSVLNMKIETWQAVLFLVSSAVLVLTFIANYLRYRFSPKQRAKKRQRYINSSYILSYAGIAVASIATTSNWYLSGRIERNKSQRIFTLERALQEESDKIVSATAAVQLSLRSNAFRSSPHYGEITGTTGYVAIAKTNQLILVLRSSTIYDHLMRGEHGAGTSLTVVRAFYDISSPEAEVQGSLQDLQTADLIQIGFLQDSPEIPDGAQVVEGSVSLVLNGGTRLTVPVPTQTVKNGIVLINPKGLALAPTKKRR